jgi:hypothetical protein
MLAAQIYRSAQCITQHVPAACLQRNCSTCCTRIGSGLTVQLRVAAAAGCRGTWLRHCSGPAHCTATATARRLQRVQGHGYYRSWEMDWVEGDCYQQPQQQQQICCEFDGKQVWGGQGSLRSMQRSSSNGGTQAGSTINNIASNQAAAASNQSEKGWTTATAGSMD